MIVQLYDLAGAYLATINVPPFADPPDLITWGGRYFINGDVNGDGPEGSDEAYHEAEPFPVALGADLSVALNPEGPHG